MMMVRKNTESNYVYDMSKEIVKLQEVNTKETIENINILMKKLELKIILESLISKKIRKVQVVNKNITESEDYFLQSLIILYNNFRGEISSFENRRIVLKNGSTITFNYFISEDAVVGSRWDKSFIDDKIRDEIIQAIKIRSKKTKYIVH